jgi:hypothetical protein
MTNFLLYALNDKLPRSMNNTFVGFILFLGVLLVSGLLGSN